MVVIAVTYIQFLSLQDPSNWLAASNIQCLALAPRSEKVGHMTHPYMA